MSNIISPRPQLSKLYKIWLLRTKCRLAKCYINAVNHPMTSSIFFTCVFVVSCITAFLKLSLVSVFPIFVSSTLPSSRAFQTGSTSNIHLKGDHYRDSMQMIVALRKCLDESRKTIDFTTVRSVLVNHIV